MSFPTKIKASPLLLALALACVAGVGCASGTGIGMARTLEPGEHRLGGGLELGLGLASTSPTYDIPLPWPQLVIGYRGGLSKRVDLGARGWGFGLRGFRTFGGEVDVKIALKKAASVEDGVDVTLDPRLSYHQAAIGRSPLHALSIRLPLLIGVNTGGGDQFVLGPSIMETVVLGPDLHPIDYLGGGVSVGYGVSVAEGIRVLPEVAMSYSPVSFNGTLEDQDRRGLTTLHLGFSVTYQVGSP